MDLGRGWNQSDAVVRQLIHLDRIFDNGALEMYVPIRPRTVDLTAEQQRTLREDFRYFEGQGLVKLHEQFGDESVHYEGFYTLELLATLTPVGAELVYSVRNKRDDKVGRRQAARDSVLHWLDDAIEPTNPHPSLAHFFQTRYSAYYAKTFETDDVNRATGWLRDSGYVTGIGGSGTRLIRLTITAKGQTMVESGGSVNDPPTTGAPGWNISGSYNTIQSQSPGATQNVMITITEDDRQQTLHLAQTIEAAQASLPAEAATEVERLRAAVEESQVDPGVLRRALESAKTTLASGAGDIVGKVILGGFGGLLARYGVGI